MTSHAHRVCNLIRLLLIALMFPWGGLCGGREEVLANGWTLDLLIERFNQREKVVIAYDLAHPPSKNWGGDGPYFGMLLNFIEKLDDRDALPFLEEKSFMTNAPSFIRTRAAEVYVSIAEVEESIAFMRKAFGVNDDKGFWRFSVSRQFLAKIGAAFDADETSDAIKQRALLILLEYMQAPANPSEASKIDEFLAQKCDGYHQSWQRMDVAQRFLGGENEKVEKHYRLIHESVTQFPPEQRIDLRKRFPDLPPLPDDVPARSPVKVAIAVGTGIVAVVVAWLALRRKKAHEAA